MNKSNSHWQTVQHDFGNVGAKAVVGDFTGGHVSDLGGMPLLQKLLLKTSMLKDFSSNIPEWRTLHLIDYSIEHQVTQRVSLVCSGYEDGIDSNVKRHDPAIRALLEAVIGNPNLASAATIGILERRIDRSTSFKLGYWFIESYVQDLKNKQVKSVVLDFDGSESRVNGTQRGSAYNAYYESKMYRPMFVCDQFGSLVIPLLRPGNAGELLFVLGLIKRIVARLREEIPDIKITIRGDAGLNSQPIYDWCEDNGIFYIFRLKGTGENGGLAVNSETAAETVEKRFRKEFGKPRYLKSQISKTKLENAIRMSAKKSRKEKLKELDTRVRQVFTEFMHAAGKGGKAKGNWRQERRILCITTYTDWGGERTFFVTNVTESNCQQLVHCLYNQRGNMERWIKELKGLDCTRLSCQDFDSNQFRLFLHGLAYRLLSALKALLPATIRHWSLQSIRKYFICLPSIITLKARQIWFRWSSLFPWMKEFHSLCRAIDRLSPLRC